MVGHALTEATGRRGRSAPKNDVSDQDVIVLGSGNLGLVYLMEERRRLSLEEIQAPHPRLLDALREHPHVGWLLVHSDRHGAVALGARGTRYLDEGRIEGEDPLAPFSPNVAAAPLANRRVRTRRGHHGRQLLRPRARIGCAFEELISFHGGIGGPQTRPFLLFPDRLPLTDEPIVGAASVHDVLVTWRRLLNDNDPAVSKGPSPTRTEVHA